MWPWEHVAIGYVAYSLLCRVRGSVPTAGSVVALTAGSLVPDLVDKPLAWWLGVLPGGRSLAHSFLFALPICLLVVLIVRQFQRTELGIAFSVGYLIHLPADVLGTYLVRGELTASFLLWPLRPLPQESEPAIDCSPALDQLHCVLGSFGLAHIVLQVVLLGSTFLMYRADGYPALGWLSERS